MVICYVDRGSVVIVLRRLVAISLKFPPKFENNIHRAL